jgi:hypothetical protein
MRSEVMLKQQQSELNPHTLADIKNLNSYLANNRFLHFNDSTTDSHGYPLKSDHHHHSSSSHTSSSSSFSSTASKNARSASLPLKVHQLYSKYNPAHHSSQHETSKEVKSWTESSISNHYNFTRAAKSNTASLNKNLYSHLSLSERDISSLMFVSGTVNGLSLSPSAQINTQMSSNNSSPLSTEVAASSSKNFDSAVETVDLNNNNAVNELLLPSNNNHTFGEEDDNNNENCLASLESGDVNHDCCSEEMFHLEQAPESTTSTSNTEKNSTSCETPSESVASVCTGGEVHSQEATETNTATRSDCLADAQQVTVDTNSSMHTAESNNDLTLTTAHSSEDLSHTLNESHGCEAKEEAATGASSESSQLGDLNTNVEKSNLQEDDGVNNSVQDTSARFVTFLVIICSMVKAR